MIRSTFQLVRGLGPAGERRLWRAGVARWRDLDAAATAGVNKRAAPLLADAVQTAARAFERGDVERLAGLLPVAERWRLLGAFGDGAAYLDIETGDDVWGREGISAIGVLDRAGPRLLLAGRDLERFPALARDWTMLVTFNGSSFDVPILRRAFPGWTPPAAHVDLRHALARLGHHGGLKAIEDELEELALARPSHLRGIDGWDACALFRRGRAGDRRALRLFAEYNLYDVINLRTLAAYAYNALAAEELSGRAPAPPRSRPAPLDPPPRRRILYDVSKIPARALSQRPLFAANVVQSATRPRCEAGALPSQWTRWAEVPCVKESGTTRPCASLWSVSSPMAAAARSALSTSPASSTWCVWLAWKAHTRPRSNPPAARSARRCGWPRRARTIRARPARGSRCRGGSGRGAPPRGR